MSSTLVPAQKRGALSDQPLKLSFYLPDLAGGGAESLTLILCDELVARGHDVELVVDKLDGDNVVRLSPMVSVYELLEEGGRRRDLSLMARYMNAVSTLSQFSITSRKPRFTWVRVTRLAAYLEKRRPDVLLSALGYTPFIAYWANLVAGRPAHIVHAEHNTPSRAFLADNLPLRRLIRLNQIKQLVRAVYPHLAGIIAVSEGAADDTAEFAQMESRRITTIYNPIPVAAIQAAAAETVDHPWLSDESWPLLVAAGRFVAQKNFRLLLESFAKLRRHSKTRLIILGDGPLRADLCARVEELGLSDRVDMPGWHPNPYAFMAKASSFVLSSDREGLGNVLIEALACGCPIVATDCQSGPREILDDGRFGRIVPTHDADALANAIEATLSAPPRSEPLIERANEFSVARSADAYTALFRDIVNGRSAAQ